MTCNQNLCTILKKGHWLIFSSHRCHWNSWAFPPLFVFIPTFQHPLMFFKPLEAVLLKEADFLHYVISFSRLLVVECSDYLCLFSNHCLASNTTVKCHSFLLAPFLDILFWCCVINSLLYVWHTQASLFCFITRYFYNRFQCDSREQSVGKNYFRADWNVN